MYQLVIYCMNESNCLKYFLKLKKYISTTFIDLEDLLTKEYYI